MKSGISVERLGKICDYCNKPAIWHVTWNNIFPPIDKHYCDACLPDKLRSLEEK